MNKTRSIFFLIFLTVFILDISGQNNAGLCQQYLFQHDDFPMKPGTQRSGKFVTDSTYYYLANLFGQTWLNTSQYKVNERDRFGNFIKATTFNFDTLETTWYAGNTYEAAYFDSIHTSTWTANVWDLKVGVWRMSDSILYLPDGSPEIAWFKVWDDIGFKFLRGKRVSYFYLENGNTEKQFTQAFDTLTRKWKNDRQDFYEYNSQDLMSKNTVIIWDTLNLLWANSELISFSYNENDLLTGQINQEWNAGPATWQNRFKAEFTYNIFGLPDERFVYEWIEATGTWLNMTHTKNLYNLDSQLTETLYQYWDDDEKAWVSNIKINYSYNSLGLRTEVYYQFWDFYSWVNMSKYLYNYDEHGNRTEYLFISWDFENNLWEDFYKETSYWSEFIPISVDELNFPKVNIYPNPASDVVNITFETEAKNAFCFLFSEEGKLMQKMIFSGNSAKINTSGFLPGTYILRISADTQSLSRKIIIH